MKKIVAKPVERRTLYSRNGVSILFFGQRSEIQVEFTLQKYRSDHLANVVLRTLNYYYPGTVLNETVFEKGGLYKVAMFTDEVSKTLISLCCLVQDHLAQTWILSPDTRDARRRPPFRDHNEETPLGKRGSIDSSLDALDESANTPIKRPTTPNGIIFKELNELTLAYDNSQRFGDSPEQRTPSRPNSAKSAK